MEYNLFALRVEQKHFRSAAPGYQAQAQAQVACPGQVLYIAVSLYRCPLISRLDMSDGSSFQMSSEVCMAISGNGI